MMRRSTDGYTYTPPQQPEPPEPPERTVSVKILQLDGTARTSLYRDEIFDVEINVTGEPAYTGTMMLKLIAAIKEECLGDRGMVQMYDFANLTPNPFCDKTIKTSITSVTFALKDKGVKRFKAVVNKEQMIQIKVIEIDDNGVENEQMSAVTPATSIDYRLRQYTKKHTNEPVNNYDANINTWVNYWTDWKIGKNGAQEPFYTFMEGSRPNAELVKAIAYKESSMKLTNLMKMTAGALNGLKISTPGEHDVDASALPEGYDPDTYADNPKNKPLVLDVVAPRMKYGTLKEKENEDDPDTYENEPTVDTVDESLKWGIRWLIAKCTLQLDAERVRYKLIRLDWWSTDDTRGVVARYGDSKDLTYEEDVELLYKEGRNPHEKDGKRDPEYLWPIKADGCPRLTATPKPSAEENPETPPQE